MAESRKEKPKTKMVIGTTRVMIIVDSGAEEVAIDDQTYVLMKPRAKTNFTKSEAVKEGQRILVQNT